MWRQSLLFTCVFLGLVLDLSKGQPGYSTQVDPYVIPPNRVIHDYKAQLEDDLYAVERKAQGLAHRECVAGQEHFEFCTLELDVIDFSLCMLNPELTQGSDAFIRGIKFSSGAFHDTPVVAVGITGIGSLAYCDVTVESVNVTANGFNVVITGGYPIYPYFITLQWIACPTKSVLYSSVRDFTPTYVPPPPPYFPLNYAPRPASNSQSPALYSQTQSRGSEENALAYNQNQQRYDSSASQYQESSAPTSKTPRSSGQTRYAQNPSNFGKIPQGYA